MKLRIYIGAYDEQDGGIWYNGNTVFTTQAPDLHGGQSGKGYPDNILLY